MDLLNAAPEMNLGGTSSIANSTMASVDTPLESPLVKAHLVEPIVNHDSIRDFVEWYKKYGNGPYVADQEHIDQVKNDDVSIAQVIADNPGLSMEEYLKLLSQYSDEYAEKYMDYVLEKESIDAANRYNAGREDTAYQRLVADLRAAGLNPAMMYGNSASPVSMASSGHVGLSEGANSRRYSNYQKMLSLLISRVLAEWQIEHEKTNDVMKGLKMIGNFFFKGMGLSMLGSGE